VASRYAVDLPAHFLQQLTILPGHDKAGTPERFNALQLKPGDLLALVGPTGAGKSRLLADIEWLARGDTPSGRSVLVNGAAVNGTTRYRVGAQLVANDCLAGARLGKPTCR
jgi:ABC-type iron transport system FetAB ATPase subunit